MKYNAKLSTAPTAVPLPNVTTVLSIEFISIITPNRLSSKRNFFFLVHAALFVSVAGCRYRVALANPRGRALRRRGGRHRGPKDAPVLFVWRFGEHRVPDGVDQRGNEDSHITNDPGLDLGLVHGEGTRRDLREGQR